MSGQPPLERERLPGSPARRVDRVCDEFEAEWRRGQTPRIEAFLQGFTEAERPDLFQELLPLELELRRARGDRPEPAEYHERFSEYGDLIATAFGREASATQEHAEHGPVPARPRRHVYDLPRSIGRYTADRVLGEGTFGTVYRAWDQGLERWVAIKVPRIEGSGPQNWSETFLREARLAAGLKHEAIVRIYDIGQAHGQCFIVMEYIDGRPMADALREGRIAHAQVADWIARVADAVHYAHTQGLVHGDLKPANILVDAQGRPHVADFGLAVHENQQRLMAGQFVGTPHYMAPEQVRGERHRIDGRADIWSLGVILYELLCRRRPFSGDTIEALLDEIQNRDAKPPRQIDDTIPRELEKTCLSCLGKRPTDRYPTAADLAAELRKWASLGKPLTLATSAPRPSVQARAAPPTSLSPLRIVLAHKRNVASDEALLGRLETGFAGRGHQVFVDRLPKIGVEWARQVERETRQADVVIPLLSAASVQSEMLTWQVQIAHDEACGAGGKPRLLPVRVGDDVPLPPELACILDRLPCFPWSGAYDDARLVDDLLEACCGPQPIRPPRPIPVGGLPLDSKSYIRRPTDDAFQSAMARRDSVVLIRGARQMGKTSLLARGIHHARESGAHVAFTDFQRLNLTELQSLEVFYKALGAAIADELELDVQPEDVWSPRRSANRNFEHFMRDQVLATVDRPVVWALDEIDRLFTCDFGSEVFALLRSWHNKRTGLDRYADLWCQLTLAIAYATEAHLFIMDPNQSPFNVGTTFTLEDFSPNQVAELNLRYQSPLRSDCDLNAFIGLVGGHPFLVNRGLYEMAENRVALAAFVAQADREDGLFGDHLRRILVLLAKDPALCDDVRRVLSGKRELSPPSFYRLRAAGVMSGESPFDVTLRTPLYKRFLEKHLRAK